MRKIAAILTGLALSGCANFAYHQDPPRNESLVYIGTREDSKAIAQIFCVKPEWHGGCYSEAVYSHCVCVLLSPLLIVDWPLEVVADTVTLSYDIDVDHKAKENRHEGIQ